MHSVCYIYVYPIVRVSGSTNALKFKCETFRNSPYLMIFEVLFRNYLSLNDVKLLLNLIHLVSSVILGSARDSSVISGHP